MPPLLWSLGLQRTNSELVFAPKETKTDTKQEAKVAQGWSSLSIYY